MAAIARTSDGLRRTLFDTLQDFVDGKIDVAQAKTIAKVADSILKSAAIDLEYQRLVRELAREDGGNKEIADLHLNVLLCKADAEDERLPNK